ncbi:MAG TPA: hypothetical protein VFR73_23670, partial [Hyphomicrobiaceae bacterium]|nr:hypothetical protein [Hyphomicrobiaceae bacterium]
LPFLASIAVVWHRFILRQERVTRLVCLRLDRTVWRYALFSFLFLLLMLVPWYFVIPLLLLGIVALDEAAVLWAILFLPLAFLVVPRFSLVLPAAALGERLSLRQAWRNTRGNTLRLALATALCTLPAALLFKLPPILLVSFERQWVPGADPQLVNVIGQLLDSVGYAVLNSLGYAVLTILAVTLLSLTYRFFAEPRDAQPSPEVRLP